MNSVDNVDVLRYVLYMAKKNEIKVKNRNNQEIQEINIKKNVAYLEYECQHQSFYKYSNRIHHIICNQGILQQKRIKTEKQGEHIRHIVQSLAF